MRDFLHLWHFWLIYEIDFCWPNIKVAGQLGGEFDIYAFLKITILLLLKVVLLAKFY